MNKGKLIDVDDSEEENEMMKSQEEIANQLVYSEKGRPSTNGQIDDYRNTFRPEIVDKKRDQIEKFAKEIPGEIVKKDYLEIGKATMTNNLERKSKKILESERDLMYKIMFNKLEWDEKEKKEV